MEPDTVAFAKSLHRASPAERVSLIRAGVSASRIPELAVAMRVSRERLLGMLNLPDASIRRQARQGVMLSMEQSERVIGLARLIGQVAVMVEDSGGPKDFDAARWIGEWLEQPVPALEGGRPADYMETLTGQALVSNLLIQSQGGVFA
ncbi:antitoxin Xre/MbcA/ParS toxin-binding domain-containing protein [Zoogloea oleivorans]|uniref:antitoxin Xre/MbcA/ParS toxin-binding domain-containing protein n=1 Tax=Zoogloea oleivorans TaxID=1552750 RepID=UPI0016528574|nr:antitoxin Xre/MbcA/ParS toxin-binding domain-containing protein [Zoogloea oleivorans]